MKNCCKAGARNTKCVRRSNQKVFTLPRKFSCLLGAIRGFTMRASCAPYRNCRSKFRR